MRLLQPHGVTFGAVVNLAVADRWNELRHVPEPPRRRRAQDISTRDPGCACPLRCVLDLRCCKPTNAALLGTDGNQTNQTSTNLASTTVTALPQRKVASNTVSWDRRQQRCFDGIVLGLGDLCAKDQLSLSQSCAMAARLGAQFDSRPSALPVCVVIEVPHKESVSMEGMMDCTAELV